MSTVEIQQEEQTPQVPSQNVSAIPPTTSLVNGYSEGHHASEKTQEADEPVSPSEIPSEDPSLPATLAVKANTSQAGLLGEETSHLEVVTDEAPEPSQEANPAPSTLTKETLENPVTLPPSTAQTEQDSQLKPILPDASQPEQESPASQPELESPASQLEQKESTQSEQEPVIILSEQESDPAVIPEPPPAPKLEQDPTPILLPEQESEILQTEQESAPSPSLQLDPTPPALNSEQEPALKLEQESEPSPTLHLEQPSTTPLLDQASPALQPEQNLGEGDTGKVAATHDSISTPTEVKEGLPESAMEASPAIQKPTENKGENPQDESKREPTPSPTTTEGDDDDYSGMPPLEDIVKSTPAQDAQSVKPFEMEDTPRMTDEDGWIDLTGNGGLKKKVIQTGLGQETRPHHGDLVAITYQCYDMEGKLLEGEEYNEVILGDWDILPGVDMALALMEDKEKAELIIPERFAYMKDDGAGPDSVAIDGPHLKMILEVKSIEKQAEENFISLERRKKFLEKKKARAGMWFSKQYFTLALACYDKILGFIEKIIALKPKESTTIEEELEEQFAKELETCHIIILNNKAACQLKLQMWNPCLDSLEEVLDKDPNNVKAIYRKAKALEGVGREDDAIVLLKNAKEHNKACREALQALLVKKKKNALSEKKMCQRMFNTTDKEKKTSPQPKLNVIRWSSAIVGGIAAVAISFILYRQLNGASTH